VVHFKLLAKGALEQFPDVVGEGVLITSPVNVRLVQGMLSPAAVPTCDKELKACIQGLYNDRRARACIVSLKDDLREDFCSTPILPSRKDFLAPAEVFFSIGIATVFLPYLVISRTNSLGKF
jgi:hypothetical protein